MRRAWRCAHKIGQYEIWYSFDMFKVLIYDKVSNIGLQIMDTTNIIRKRRNYTVRKCLRCKKKFKRNFGFLCNRCREHIRINGD
jgi:hypothetical protein